MQLRNARLCLDCEELHDQQHCPICASESFVFLTRWVPVDERRRSPRPPTPPAEDPPPAGPLVRQWLTRGVAGVVLVAATQWLWRSRRGNGPEPPATGGSTAGADRPD